MKTAREIAFKAIYDIENKQLYSNIAVNKYLKESDLKNQDRGFATELIYGVVENKYLLEYILEKFSTIKLKKLSKDVKTILKMGIYQIIFLDGVEDFAAVNESVNLCKKYNKKASGFVNGVLRNVVREKENIKYPLRSDIVKHFSVKYSYEPWIIKRWLERFSKEFVEDLLVANSEKPPLYIRVNTLKISTQELLNKLKNQGIDCQKIGLIDECIKVNNMKNIEKNDLFKKGYFQVQDLSSMLVGHILNPNKNSLVLDCCSAPGGKTTHIATKMENSGLVVARDIFDHKLNLIRQSVKRLGLSNVKVEKFDATQFDSESVEKFDYVLVDAPCSGFGIIRRKPEIKYKDEEEVNKLPELQQKILNNNSKYVKKGGLLIYSTCTIEDKENIQVIDNFLKENENFELEPIENINIDLENQHKGYISLYPNIHGVDGFFIAKMRRVR
ncbi:16S rRNA (cytosine967-C5)-methyltransferase [Alkalithermobacter thermoalcaliphilus JW-YL-7 = DSM 7308]|uniref:16S rRNA (cytosine(967)-C(5))-methyltransferase n=1 Tax=Alkalithermobacter thermoalcaliphilus JW-YL-7 = DSM 7308 TaxID=1121328 RepID=A0A150FPP9_CLOPD|nr:sun protein [[Clostridium] paradoxum JW-YL-7 = DSM 7308]SHK96388.1 16S rRNA (cytosine967-C5)-methyltransferase [[Clostridium] paradoxum JW-YL-7 = DSM 7308]